MQGSVQETLLISNLEERDFYWDVGKAGLSLRGVSLHDGLAVFYSVSGSREHFAHLLFGLQNTGARGSHGGSDGLGGFGGDGGSAHDCYPP